MRSRARSLVVIVAFTCAWVMIVRYIRDARDATIQRENDVVNGFGPQADLSLSKSSFSPPWLVNWVLEPLGINTDPNIDSISINLKSAPLKSSLAGLNGLPRLSRLRIVTAVFIDSDLMLLRGLSRLEHLEIVDGSLTNEGLLCISTQMPSLKTLELSRTTLGTCLNRIDSKGIQYLATLKYLEKLDISGSEISAAAIDDIAKIASLRELVIGGKPLSPSNLDEIRRKLPLVTISMSGE